MKNQLNARLTRNVFILMVMVLALGVSESADAIDRLTRSSGDLQTVTVGNDYQIRFTVGLQSPRRGSTYTNYRQTPTSNISVDVSGKINKTAYHEPEAAGGTEDYDPQVTYDVAHDYEQESILIAVAGGSIIKKVGSYDVPSGENTSLTMYESTHNSYSRTSNPHQRLSSSVTLTLTAPAATPSEVTAITITPTTDGPSGHVNPSPLVITVYVVGSLNSTGTTTVADADGVQLVSDQSDMQINDDFTFTPGDHQPVYYSVEGSGRLYVSLASDRKSRATNNLFTSSLAPVYLDTNGGSSKVTAYVSGSSGTAKVLYVFSGARLSELPQIEIVSGDNQTGAPQGRLDNYFEVKVTDGRRRPISGLPVTFTRSDPGTPDPGSMFIPVSGTRIYTEATFDGPESIDAERPAITVATPTNPGAAATHRVQTDRNGVAKIYYQLSANSGAHGVTATAHGIGINTTLAATASSTARARLANLEIVSGDNQRGEKGKYLKNDLVVIVRSLAGHRVQNAIIQFRTTIGTLVPAEGTDQPATVFNQAIESAIHPRSGQQIYVETGPNGEAGVSYNVGQVVEARDVIAEVREEAQTSTQYDFAIDRVVFNVNGRASASTGTGSGTGTGTGTGTGLGTGLGTGVPTVTTRVPPSVSGTAGETATLTVTAAAIQRVTVGGLGDTFPYQTGATSFTQSGTTFTSTLTLPDQAGDYSLTVFVGNTRYSVTVTATAPPVRTGTLNVRVDPFSGNPGTTATVTITATDQDGQPANITVSLRATGGTLDISSVSTGTDGTATARLVRGNTPGSGNYVTATATGTTDTYEAVQSRFLIAGTPPPSGQQQDQQQQQQQTETMSEPGEPAYIDIYDGDDQSGPLNVQLQDALVVEVLDEDENPVENVRVGFSVTQGSGRLSPRSVRTDDSGFAEVNFTPTSAGEIIVRARVAGVDEVEFTVMAGDPPDSLTIVSGDNQASAPGNRLANALVVEVRDEDGDPIEGTRVTFAVTAGGGRLSETSVITNAQGRAQTSLTLGGARAVNSVQASVADLDPVTFNTSIDAVIHVAAANRPVMYWIDDGALYRLAGAKAEQIAPSANDVAVDAARGKIYYIVGTSATTGRIYSENVDGTGLTVVKELTSVPMGLALDTANAKLYLTNSWGKIQRMNVDGSQFETNLIVGLRSPQHIAVSGNTVYWTDANRNVRVASVVGDKTPRTLATSPGAIGGIAVSGNTVYWTEQTGSTTGRIRSANFNGGPAVAADLFTLTAVPHGIAIDGNTLYWANGWGKVQRRNIDRSKFQDVVTGLIAPGALAVGGANPTTPTVSQTTDTPRPRTANTKYDVNGDGTVNNVDVGIVVAAVLSGSQQANLDVNGDGTVDLTDVVAVSQNVDTSGTAAAPALRTRLSAVQVDRIQAQIDLLIGMNDRSPGALYTLSYLQHLLASARPEKTQLLANYPNPFNPETWIPYELAADTNVKLTIYNAQGIVVRTLQLGHQTSGYYTTRDRAAYWDGRNSSGELVASGLYFYQLETEKASMLRKMVILK